jgi:hypothetical protein
MQLSSLATYPGGSALYKGVIPSSVTPINGGFDAMDI